MPRKSNFDKKVDKAQQVLMKYFYDDRTGQIYDRRDKNRDKNLPTPEEVKKEIPNPAGWSTGMEDGAIGGGAMLEGLVRGHMMTGEKKIAHNAEKIWKGLKTFGTVSKCKGFICRGVIIADGKSYYPNSSGDQYTLYCSGLFRYLQSSLPTEADRQLIAEISESICNFVMNANMDINRSDGKPGIFGGAGRDVVHNGRKLRIAGPGILEYLALAAFATGKNFWLKKYEKYRDAYDRLPLRRLVDTEWTMTSLPKKCNYIYMQGAYLFRMLYDFETDKKAKNVYKKVLGRIARYSLDIVERYDPKIFRHHLFKSVPDLGWRKDYQHLKEINKNNPNFIKENPTRIATVRTACRPRLFQENKFIREPIECVTSIMLSEDRKTINKVKDPAKRIINTISLDKILIAPSLYNIPTIYWRGKELNLW